VAEIEAQVREQVRLGRAGGPMLMLTSTIALEHFTAMMAETRESVQHLFDRTDPEIERLWHWHAMEEMEHKAVAFDVFMEVTKGWSPMRRYLQRVLSMAIITAEFSRRIGGLSAQMLEADGYSPAAARKAVRRFLWGDPGIFRRGWRSYIAWYRPGFHPWDNDNRHVLADWRADFEARTAASPAALAGA
jgi:predicted metal-dependent hydrolase